MLDPWGVALLVLICCFFYAPEVLIVLSFPFIFVWSLVEAVWRVLSGQNDDSQGGSNG